jgi:hypothetical protein
MLFNVDKQRRKLAKKWLNEPPSPFVQIDLSQKNHPEWMTRAFQNNRYIVMVCDNAPTTHGPAIRAMVQKIDDTPISFRWREMQNIKNAIFGKETIAVEYYPPASELIDKHNIYWMWIFQLGILPVPIITDEI